MRVKVRDTLSTQDHPPALVDLHVNYELDTINLVSRLCRSLEEKCVRYCHWKSNNALDRSATGENDLDLLVSRADAQLFAHILSGLGFKEAEEVPEKRLPGILNYYGYDREADKLVHVHAHYQLILGHDLTKNYHLPLEREFFKSAFQRDLFKVPEVELEYIVFIIRMILKHATWDTVLMKQGALSTSEREELAYLQVRVDHTRIGEILRLHLPSVNASLFDKCVQVHRLGSSTWSRIMIGRELQSKLKAHARRAGPEDTCLRIWRAVSRRIERRVFKRVFKKRLANGGALIAIVGGDGSGKTTATNEIRKWLAKNFETKRVHLGKPPQSWMTIVVRGIVKVGRLLGVFPYLKASLRYNDNLSSRRLFQIFPLLLRETCTARDRYLAYIKAQRFASNGNLVICDRFPLPQIKLMDAPVVQRLTGAKSTHRVILWLQKLENRYYQSIAPPEYLFALKVDPEIAVKRKVGQDLGEDPSTIRPRSQEIWVFDWETTPAHVIDTSRPLNEVLSEVKSIKWTEI